MASPAAYLDVLVRAETDKAEKNLRTFNSMLGRTDRTSASATVRTSRLGKATTGLGTGLGRAARYAAGAAAAYLSISQAKTAVTTTQDLAKTTVGLNRNLGIGIKRSSQWAGVAKARDIDTKALNLSFTTLSRNLLEARKGTEANVMQFERLGVSQKELMGLSFNESVLKVADAFGEAEGSAKRQATAQKLLGRGYQTILPMFSEGAKGLKEQLMWAKEYGVELDRKTVKEQMKLVNAQRESKEAFMGLQVAFAQFLTPALQKANKQFQRIQRIMADDKLTDEQKWKRVGNIIAGWADKARDAFLKVLPEMVEQAGETAPKIAAAFLEGFKNADWNAKMWLLAALGGKMVLGGLGTRAGMMMANPWGLAVAAGIASAIAGYKWADVNAEGIKKVFGDIGTGPQELGAAQLMPMFDLTLAKAKKLDKYMEDHPGLGAPEALDAMNRASHKAGKVTDGWVDKSERDLDKLNRAFGHSADMNDKSMDRVVNSAKDTKNKVGNSIWDMVGSVADGYSRIAENTNKALSALHVKKLSFSINKDRPGGSNSFGGHHTSQTGGPVPGSGSGDKISALLEPGEFVVNKRAAQRARPLLDAINSRIPRFARGGSVTGDIQGLNPGLMSAMGRMSGASGTPIRVNSGWRSYAEQVQLYQRWLNGTGNLAARPGTSNHESGNAADIAPGSGTFGGIAPKFGLGFPVPGEPWHIELMGAAAKGAFGPKMAKLARVVLEGPAGPWKSMGQSGLDKVWKGAKAYLSNSLPTSTGVAVKAPKGTLSGPQLQSLWGRSNPDLRSHAHAMAMKALGESGGDPRAIGHDPGGSIGYGLWQVTSPQNRDLIAKYGGVSKMLTAGPNALAAGDIFRRQGIGAWYAPSIPFQRGGEVMPSLDTGGRVTRAGVAQVHPGDVHRGSGPIEIHLYGSMDAVLDEVDVLIDGRKADIAEYTLREGGRHRGRARQLRG